MLQAIGYLISAKGRSGTTSSKMACNGKLAMINLSLKL
jgi:hypothetical protein